MLSSADFSATLQKQLKNVPDLKVIDIGKDFNLEDDIIIQTKNGNKILIELEDAKNYGELPLSAAMR